MSPLQHPLKYQKILTLLNSFSSNNQRAAQNLILFRLYSTFFSFYFHIFFFSSKIILFLPNPSAQQVPKTTTFHRIHPLLLRGKLCPIPTKSMQTPGITHTKLSSPDTLSHNSNEKLQCRNK